MSTLPRIRSERNTALVTAKCRCEALRIPIPGDEVWAGTRSGDRKAMERLCRTLTERLRADRIRAARYKSNPRAEDAALKTRKEALSERDLSYLAWEMVARCAERRWFPPLALSDLLRVLLKADTYASTAPSARERGWAEAAYYQANHPHATPREVEQHTAVSHVTINGWIKTEEFSAAVAQIRAVRSKSVK